MLSFSDLVVATDHAAVSESECCGVDEMDASEPKAHKCRHSARGARQDTGVPLIPMPTAEGGSEFKRQSDHIRSAKEKN